MTPRKPPEWDGPINTRPAFETPGPEIRAEIERQLSDYQNRNGRLPSAIYLSPGDHYAFAQELSRPTGVDFSRMTCPHCGKSLFNYAGVPVLVFGHGKVLLT